MLTKIHMVECSNGVKGGNWHGPFDGDPSGRYEMNMEQPVQRAKLRLILSLLHGMASDRSVPLSKLFLNATSQKRDGGRVAFNFNNVQLGADGVWKVPTQGALQFEVSAVDAFFSHKDFDTKPGTVIERITRHFRATLGENSKALAVLCIVKSMVDEESRKMLLDALSCDFVLRPEQVQALCQTRLKKQNCGKDPVGTCCKLLPCLVGHAHIRSAALLTRSIGDLLRIGHIGRWMLTLNLENPVGHYTLALGEPSDKNTAEKLLLLNRWEVQISQAAGHTDTSQSGNLKNFRNVVYCERPFVWSTEEWRLPGSEAFSFDYVSLRRPPLGAQPLEDEVWRSVLRSARCAMLVVTDADSDVEDGSPRATEPPASRSGAEDCAGQSSTARPEEGGDPALPVAGGAHDARTVPKQAEKSPTQMMLDSSTNRLSDTEVVWALKAVASEFWLTTRQVRSALCLFFRPESRKDCLSILFSRAVDWPLNGKACRPKFKQSDWMDLMRRVGYLALFPFFQVEHQSFSLDLSVAEQRRNLHVLARLAVAESPMSIQKTRIDWTGPNTHPVWSAFVSGVPLTWGTEQIDYLPSRGVFEGTYCSSQDDVRLKARLRLARSVGWHLQEDGAKLESILTLWSVLDEVPKEVLQLVEWITSKSFTDDGVVEPLQATFKACDVSGDKNLQLQEFVTGITELGFRLPPEPRRRRGPLEKSQTGLPRSEQSARTKQRSQAEKQQERKVQVLTAVYRWLNPNNDGNLSVKEFGFLQGVYRELRQTTWEFVQHIKERFGSLATAWDAADHNGNGQIDQAEFHWLARRWRFDGPTRQIFMFLDDDGSDSIGATEWLKLQDISAPAW